MTLVVNDGTCTNTSGLDGVRYPLMGEKFDNIVNPQEIEGIEVYPHITETPPEFVYPGQNCGSIVIWSRVGN